MSRNEEGWDVPARHYAHPSRRAIIAGAATASIAVGMPSGVTAQSEQSVSGTAAFSVPVNLTVNGTRHALTLDPRTTVLDLLREHLDPDRHEKGLRSGPMRRLHRAH